MRHAAIAFPRRVTAVTYEEFTLGAGSYSDGKGGTMVGYENIYTFIGSLTPTIYKGSYTVTGVHWSGGFLSLEFNTSPGAANFSKLEIYDSSGSTLIGSFLRTAVYGSTPTGWQWTTAAVFAGGTTYKLRIYY